MLESVSVEKKGKDERKKANQLFVISLFAEEKTGGKFTISSSVPTDKPMSSLPQPLLPVYILTVNRKLPFLQ